MSALPPLACAAWMHANGQGAQVPFLQACWDDPLSDVPRLVYADWLDEHGEPERARYIRVACKLNEFALAWNPFNWREERTLVKEAEGLLQRNRRRWLRGVPQKAQKSVVWVRGLPSGLRLDAITDLAYVRTLVERLPIMENLLWAHLLIAEETAWAACWPHLANMRRLRVGSFFERTANVGAFFSRLTHLVDLELFAHGSSLQVLRTLAQRTDAAALCSVYFYEARITAATGHLLATHPAFAHLQQLRLRQPDDRGVDYEHWLGSANLAACQTLALEHTRLGVDGLIALAHNPAAQGVRTLTVIPVPKSGFRALAASSHLTALETLELWNVVCSADDLRTLARNSHLLRLRHLTIRYSRLHDRAQGLADGPLLGRITYLDLTQSYITPVDVIALTQHPGATHWTHLSLAENPLNAAGVQALARRRDWRLTHLDLSGTGSSLVALNLIAQGYFPHLQEADLSMNPLEEDDLVGQNWPPTLRWLNLNQTRLHLPTIQRLLAIMEQQPRLHLGLNEANLPPAARAVIDASPAGARVEWR